MNSLAVLLLLALVGGIAAGLQGPLAGILGRQVGIAGSVFIVHLGGMVFSLPFLLSNRLSTLQNWNAVPWYALAAGGLGLILVGALTYCIPHVGVGNTLTMVVLGQMSVAVLLDHYGHFVSEIRPVDPIRILGLVLLLVGTWCIVR